jgi:UDPglucose--hexose-1-phosphate uridylyltransferase
MAKERAMRPSDFKSPASQKEEDVFCPFCEGNEDKTPPEILAYRKEGTLANQPGWRLRVIPNKFPALRIEGDLGKHAEGMYDMMNGVGAHEVIVESPEHLLFLTQVPVSAVREMLWAYRDRLLDLKKDKRFLYGLIFKNVGREAGASLLHTHSQLIATPFVPIRIGEEVRGAGEFFGYRGRCIFCDMVEQEREEKARVVLETDQFIALAPFASRFPFETWIVPREHLSHFENSPKQVMDDLAVVLRSVLGKLEQALESPPYNYVIHSTPWDREYLEHYHWHIEIIPRLTKTAGFEWGTGCYINPVLPEDAAKYLREID